MCNVKAQLPGDTRALLPDKVTAEMHDVVRPLMCDDMHAQLPGHGDTFSRWGVHTAAQWHKAQLSEWEGSDCLNPSVSQWSDNGLPAGLLQQIMKIQSWCFETFIPCSTSGSAPSAYQLQFGKAFYSGIHGARYDMTGIAPNKLSSSLSYFDEITQTETIHVKIHS